LLQASGIEPALAGATLLLGASMGGELFNPGAVEIRTLAELTGDSSLEIIRAVAPRNLLASAVALGAFWFLAERKRRATPTEPSAPVSGTSSAPDDEHEPIHVLKALVPLLPLALLFLEPFAASALGRPRVLAVDERAFPRLSEPVTILAAMLAGVAAAALVERRVAGRLASAFFEGAGYAYTHVISLIAVAMVFASGIEASGLMSAAARSARQLPWLLEPATWITACFFAWVCGSGIAPAVAVMRIVVPEAEPLDLDPKDLGGMAATGGHFGRTMSPAAAVVAMASRLSQVEPRPILQYVAGPLLLGGSVLILATVFGWV
jgi:DcuC family C4-dicarboxylate transporter